MRDIALTGLVLIGCLWTLRTPFVGVLMWTWITLMAPHQLTFGFSQSFHVNMLVAVVTIGAWLVSKERKLPRIDAAFTLPVLFFLWFTFNGFIGVDAGSNWPMWDRVWRIMLLGILVSISATNRIRIHAMMMIWALSLLYFGVKGGGFTLTGGGNSKVMGPPDTMIGDNNQLAL